MPCRRSCQAGKPARPEDPLNRLDTALVNSGVTMTVLAVIQPLVPTEVQCVVVRTLRLKDKFNLMARSLTSPGCCAVTHVLAVAQLSVYTEESACSRHDHHFARCLSKVTELIMSGGARTEFN